MLNILSSISAIDWVVSILMFIIALAVLITIHELGHFSMAKLFNVYCQEFSIGFGPKLLKKRRKGGETYFSIRAIPLGGYVSMYGEEIELEDGVNVPEERSLEGIKKWKKAIILAAGIILNFSLGYVFIFVSDVCFPTVYLTSNVTVVENSVAYEAGIRSDYHLYIYGSEITVDGISNFSAIPVSGTSNSDINNQYGYIIDDNVVYNDANYVLMYIPTGNRSEPVFSQSVYLFQASETPNEEAFKNWIANGYSLPYYPDFSKEYLHPSLNASYSTTLSFYVPCSTTEGDIIYDSEKVNATFEMVARSDDTTNFYWQDVGMSFQNRNEWLPFATRLENTFIDYGSAASAIFKGIGMLFTGQSEVSGIIGIMTQSATIYSSYTFATYFYFWAVISINLAIFNLLPFPGLDGWSLLVTAIEGATRKKIPNKVKNIVSAIGLIILFGFMIIILIIDILRLIGIM